MTSEAFRRVLDLGARQLGLELSDELRRRLDVHFELLCLWASKVNLTTVLDPESAASVHYLDSLAFGLVDDSEGRIVDVGSGAGFPGLVLAAATDRPVVLVEPLRKRTSFLRRAAAAMGLTRIEVVRARLEAADRTGFFPCSDVIVSRATFPPEDWLDRARHVLAPGGRLILSRGRGGAARAALEARAAEAGLWLAQRVELELPGGHHRTLDRWQRRAADEN